MLSFNTPCGSAGTSKSKLGKQECEDERIQDNVGSQELLDEHLTRSKILPVGYSGHLPAGGFHGFNFLTATGLQPTFQRSFLGYEGAQQFSEGRLGCLRFLSVLPMTTVFDVLEMSIVTRLSYWPASRLLSHFQKIRIRDSRNTSASIRRGKLDLQENRHAAAFFRNAPESLRSYFLEHAGRTFESGEGPFS